MTVTCYKCGKDLRDQFLPRHYQFIEKRKALSELLLCIKCSLELGEETIETS